MSPHASPPFLPLQNPNHTLSWFIPAAYRKAVVSCGTPLLLLLLLFGDGAVVGWVTSSRIAVKFAPGLDRDASGSVPVFVGLVILVREGSKH